VGRAVPDSSAASVVEEFVRRLSSGDMDGACELLADEITVHECESVPYPGDHVGRDEFFRLREGFFASWVPRGKMEIRLRDAGPEYAVALVRIPVTARATGREFELRQAESYTVRDGRIVDLELYYFDTKKMWDMCGGARVL
jgi:uncharacterized protein